MRSQSKRTIFKSKVNSRASKVKLTVELEEIKRNKHRNSDEQNGTAVVEEANDGNKHELPVNNCKGDGFTDCEGAQGHSEQCDEAPRQIPEDQLVTWKRLHEIRLS